MVARRSGRVRRNPHGRLRATHDPIPHNVVIAYRNLCWNLNNLIGEAQVEQALTRLAKHHDALKAFLKKVVRNHHVRRIAPDAPHALGDRVVGDGSPPADLVKNADLAVGDRVAHNLGFQTIDVEPDAHLLLTRAMARNDESVLHYDFQPAGIPLSGKAQCVVLESLVALKAEVVPVAADDRRAPVVVNHGIGQNGFLPLQHDSRKCVTPNHAIPDLVAVAPMRGERGVARRACLVALDHKTFNDVEDGKP